MNDTSGWIKIHRSILNWEWWDDHNTTRLFLYCLLEANHEDKKWHGENIERGTFITSLSHLSQNTGLSTQQIRTSLERLISTNEITKKTTNKLTKITICKYDIYQDVQQAEQQAEQQAIQQTNNKQITTTKEYKNIRNKEYKIEDTNVSLSDSKSDEEKIDYDGLIAYWNNTTNGIWGNLKNIENNRKKMVRARIREHGKKTFMFAIQKACQSSYLKSQTWFNFDWLIKPNNFDKLIAGNYNHDQQTQPQICNDNSQLGYMEQIDQQGNRFYMQGKMKVVVPLNAPPRPNSDRCYWSNTRQEWYYD